MPDLTSQLSHRPAIRSRRERRLELPTLGSYVVLGLVALSMVVPFLYVLSLSFKHTYSLLTYPPHWFPLPPYLGNYSTLLFHTEFARWFLNTLIVASGVTLIKLVIDSCAGYAFAKLDFPFKEPLFVLSLCVLMVPLAATLIPMFLVVRWMGLLNTYEGLMLPGLANPVGIFLMRQFIQQLPADLDNAARLDGASEPTILFRVIMPLCKPALATLAVFYFLTQWVLFIWPLVVANASNMRLITVGIFSMQGQFNVDWGLIAAGAVLIVLPTAIAFVIFMRYFVAGTLAGALRQ
jgi:multiple sugar transport system permease protein